MEKLLADAVEQSGGILVTRCAGSTMISPATMACFRAIAKFPGLEAKTLLRLYSAADRKRFT